MRKRESRRRVETLARIMKVSRFRQNKVIRKLHHNDGVDCLLLFDVIPHAGRWGAALVDPQNEVEQGGKTHDDAHDYLGGVMCNGEALLTVDLSNAHQQIDEEDYYNVTG
jgi:hypothetical protein